MIRARTIRSLRIALALLAVPVTGFAAAVIPYAIIRGHCWTG